MSGISIAAQEERPRGFSSSSDFSNHPLAERAGFEPAIPLRVCRISSAVLSTTQPPLLSRATAGPFWAIPLVRFPLPMTIGATKRAFASRPRAQSLGLAEKGEVHSPGPGAGVVIKDAGKDSKPAPPSRIRKPETYR